ncbi:MAG: 3-isopropylmalate dehydrogenase [Pseudomonadota bacterium]|nr:3-isopropylmalate dehydrogenase [Pseudomonadota bacterium]
MKEKIAILPGDGIGPEVTTEAVKIIEAVANKYDHSFELIQGYIGGSGLDKYNDPFPNETERLCKDAAAVLLGAVGGPKWDDVDTDKRPERGLLRLRAALSVFANLRPVSPNPILSNSSPIRTDLLEGVDLMIVRELTGGIYFGKKDRTKNKASDLCTYTREEIERVVRIAANLARKRQQKLTSVDKSNVLETSRLWREVCTEIMENEYPEIEVEHLLVDAAAMHLLSRPSEFDVIVTENMFGDILTDEASMLAGSMGLLPSASLNDGKTGLYEPIHGSAPDIAGKNIANPCGTILSAAMLLRHSLDLDNEAKAIETAVNKVLIDGLRTADIASKDKKIVSTNEMGDAILEALE